MKYAILSGPFITKLANSIPPEGTRFAEISDADAAKVSSGFSQNPRIVHAIWNGSVVTEEEYRQARIPKITAEQHIQREGYTAIRLVSLLDLEGKLAQAGKTSAKLTAVRAWLDGIMATFAANPESRNDWPKAPFSYEATVQEAAS